MESLTRTIKLSIVRETVNSRKRQNHQPALGFKRCFPNCQRTKKSPPEATNNRSALPVGHVDTITIRAIDTDRQRSVIDFLGKSARRPFVHLFTKPFPI